jgi:cellulose synthase/poly-beta-1,6-N-acetylglucosamine synthase-like glycosyltransferase
MPLLPASALLLAAGFLVVLVTLPLLLELLLVTVAVMVLRGRSSVRASLPAIRHLAIIVPSHNEELLVAKCVESLRVSAERYKEADRPIIDILVIAHNCMDATASCARQAGARVLQLDDPARRGKGEALQEGFQYAAKELGADSFLVVDADSEVSLSLVREACMALRNASVVQCRYEFRRLDTRAESRLRAVAFFCMNGIRPLGRSRLGLSSGILGNGFAFRSEVLQQVPYRAKSIVEDLEFHLALLIAGIRVAYVASALVSSEAPRSSGALATQTARWEGGRLRMLIAVAPRMAGRVLRGDLRLIEPLLDLAGIPIAFEVALLCLLIPLWSLWLHLYLAAAAAIIMLHLAVVIGMSPDPTGDAMSLLYAPFYVVKKILMMPSTLRMAGGRAAWIRTERVEINKSSERQ